MLRILFRFFLKSLSAPLKWQVLIITCQYHQLLAKLVSLTVLILVWPSIYIQDIWDKANENKCQWGIWVWYWWAYSSSYHLQCLQKMPMRLSMSQLFFEAVEEGKYSKNRLFDESTLPCLFLPLGDGQIILTEIITFVNSESDFAPLCSLNSCCWLYN